MFALFVFLNLQRWSEERGNYIKGGSNVRETIFQSRNQLTRMCKFKRFVVRCKLPSGIAGVFPVGLATHGWATSPETPICRDKNMPHAVWLSDWPASSIVVCVCACGYIHYIPLLLTFPLGLFKSWANNDRLIVLGNCVDLINEHYAAFRCLLNYKMSMHKHLKMLVYMDTVEVF